MNNNVKLVEQKVYAAIYGHCDSVSYLLSDMGDDPSYYDKQGYMFLCTVMVPVVSISDKKEMLLRSIENDIAEQQLKINRLFDKKNQLLAIDHKAAE